VLKENRQGLKVLAAGTFLNLFLGMIYIWGIFVIPVSQALVWDVEAVKITASFTIGFFSLGGLLGGKLHGKLGASKVTMLGGLMLGSGSLLAAFTPAAFPWLLYLTYGILGGMGGGMGYISVVSSAQKWFPSHRGIATGICVGAFGLSVTVFAPVVGALLGAVTLRQTFLALSAAYFAASLLLGRMVKFPESGEVKDVHSDGKRQFTMKEMIRQREFWHIIVSFLLVTVAFFVVNPAAQTLSIYRGFDPGFATVLLMITGISNTFGRMVLPIFSGKVRNENIVVCLMIILAAASFTLSFATGPLFVVMIALIPMCFGAALSVFPLITADYFGLKNLGENYGTVALGFAFSALVMPGVIGLWGSYNLRFLAVAALSVLGIYTMGSLSLAARRKKAAGN